MSLSIGDDKLFSDPSTTSTLYSWFYLVYLIQYSYLSVKFVMWIVKQKIENKLALFKKNSKRSCTLGKFIVSMTLGSKSVYNIGPCSVFLSPTGQHFPGWFEVLNKFSPEWVHTICQSYKHSTIVNYDWKLSIVRCYHILIYWIQINLPKSPTFLGIFCISVKIYHFSSEIIFGQLL